MYRDRLQGQVALLLPGHVTLESTATLYLSLLICETGFRMPSSSHGALGPRSEPGAQASPTMV